MASTDYISDGVEPSVYCTHIRRKVFGQAISCDDCGHVITPEPTSPSVAKYSIREAEYDALVAERDLFKRRLDTSEVCRNNLADALAKYQEELKLRNQDIEDLRLTNRNLSRKIVEDARKRGEAATQQPSWPRGIHGS